MKGELWSSSSPCTRGVRQVGVVKSEEDIGKHDPPYFRPVPHIHSVPARYKHIKQFNHIVINGIRPQSAYSTRTEPEPVAWFLQVVIHSHVHTNQLKLAAFILI
jgi:hypothetical protein